MKKFLIVLATFGFAIAQINAQTPAPTLAKKTAPAAVQATDSKMTPAQPAATPATKPAKAKTAKPASGSSDAAKPAAPLKKDGTPDKRYSANKHLKKDGTPDKRFKEHKDAPKPASTTDGGVKK